MSFQLTIAEGKEAGKEMAFDQASVVIGRTSECDVVLYDPGVSRKHARIFAEGDSYFVEDMGSSNGTKVNGAQVKKQQLGDGDSISLGPVVFKFFPKELAEEPRTDGAGGGVTEQSTRIVTADQVKRQRNKGVALLPEGVAPEGVEALGRTATATMQALKRTSGSNMPVARRPSGDSPAARRPPRASGDGDGDGEDAAPQARAPRGRPASAEDEAGDAPLAKSPRGRASANAEAEEEAPLARRGRAGAEDESPARASKKGAATPLAASERARIRRESKGMVANFKIFWLESSPRTRASVGGGAAALAVVLLGILYFFGLRDVTPLPTHPEPVVLARKPIADSFGLGEGVTWKRADMKVFSFEFNAPVRAVVLLHFQAKDVAQGEVVITVNGADVGNVPADTMASSERSHEVIIPASTLKKGEANQIIFDNTKNPPGEEDWRIWNVWIETALLPEIPPDMLILEANKAFQRAQLFNERRDVGAENRYMAWKTYREAWLMLEAHPEPKPELYLLARDKVKEAQQELDRTCAKLLLEEEGYYNTKDWNAARSTLDHIKSYFPANDQPCAFRAEQKRNDHGL